MIRAAVLSLSLAAFPAAADVIAYTENMGGGQIILTDRKGYCQSGLLAYTRGSNQRTDFGCWSVADGFVFVKWQDGDLRTYFDDTFKMVAKPPKKGAI